MLSRVAENILWMSRYVERAENTARILDVNFRLLLDVGDGGDLAAAWEPLVSLVPQTRVLFDSLYADLTPETVCRFMTFERENPDSIVNAVAAARENARSIRESISSEMWETLNGLYLQVTGPGAEAAWSANPHTFYRQVQYGSQQFQGTTDATMLHDEGWHFLQVGKFLERADSATRILDSKYRLLLGQTDRPVDTVQWIAVLRSCSAYEGFRRRQEVAHIAPRDVAHFLLLDPFFPRSVLFCINEAWTALRGIGTGQSQHDARPVERSLGLLQAQLRYADIDDVLCHLHEYLDEMQIRFNRVGAELHDICLHGLVRPVFNTAAGRAAQAMGEQQQQAASEQEAVGTQRQAGRC